MTNLGRTEFVDNLAFSYATGADIYVAAGEPLKALAFHDETVRIRTHLVHQEGMKWLVRWLVASLNNRANLLARLHRLPQATRDFTSAIELFSPEFLPFFGENAAVVFAECLIARGGALLELNQIARAVIDFDKALELYGSEGKSSDEVFAELRIAQVLINRALVKIRMENLSEALMDLSNAIDICQRHLSVAPDTAFLNTIIYGLRNRSMLFRALGNVRGYTEDLASCDKYKERLKQF